MALNTIVHEVDFCVVGGGLAGMCAAIAAARQGAKVILMQERPVLGGNTSSEIRMWICGASGKNNRETGIVEELSLENYYRNPYRNWSIWDSVLYGKTRYEDRLELLLNCSCMDAGMDGDRIRWVKGWQMTTQTFHQVHAKLFADCSGDSILAPLTGAEYKMGRESRREYGETLAVEKEDRCTMGMSCLLQARETTEKRGFIAPDWAAEIPEEQLETRSPDMNARLQNFWYLELGGDKDSIHDTEAMRDQLIPLAFGLWKSIKKDNRYHGDNWELDWVGFLPGKRESRRYVGDHVLCQADVDAGGHFDDLIAYGGWPMDDHYPEGFYNRGNPNENHNTPSPFGIPYRCLYSKNIENLMFAGRNISASHIAMSATRVMATCALLGQAAGTAAAIAVRDGLTPRGVYQERIGELKQSLMEQDCWLPFNRRKISSLTAEAQIIATSGDPQVLRNGYDRPIGDADNGWYGKVGDTVTFQYDKPREISELRLVFDSDLERETLVKDDPQYVKATSCNIFLDSKPAHVPDTIVKRFKVEALQPDGSFATVLEEENNYQRLARYTLNCRTSQLRITFLETWGGDRQPVHVFAADLY